jgi:hypothetical protein
MPSWIGLLFTLQVIIVSGVYSLRRWDAVVNYKASSIAVLETENSFK